MIATMINALFFIVSMTLILSAQSVHQLHRHRMLIANTVVAIGLGVSPFLTTPAVAVADDSSSPIYEVKKMLSALPTAITGMGKPDVPYPVVFRGTWKVSQTITDVVENLNGVSSRPELVMRIESFRDSPLDLTRYYSQFDNYVILDRGVSMNNLFKVLYKTPTITTFDPQNPNVVSTVFPDGSKLNMLTTKRAVEDLSGEGVSSDSGAVGYSELYRILEEPTGTSPRLYAARLLARYKTDPDNANRILGQERLYFYDDANADGGKAPTVVIKSKILMNRIVE